jgi:tetratricopeptide (TPR) repeat protein
VQSPDTLPAADLAQLRAEIEAQNAEQARRHGHELLAEGARLLSQRRPGEAAAKLQEAATLLPDSVEVAINLGGAFVMQHRYRQAVPILERASQLAPDNPMVWTNLAAAYLGRLETSGPQQQLQAIQAYERALLLDPQAPNIDYNLGLIYQDRRDWPQARRYFRRALQVNSHDGDAQRWLDKLDRIETAAAAAQDAAPASSHHELDSQEQGG